VGELLLQGQENEVGVVENLDRARILSRIANAPASLNAAVSSALRRDMLVHRGKTTTATTASIDIQQSMAQQMLELRFQREAEAQRREEREIERAAERPHDAAQRAADRREDELRRADDNRRRDEENRRRDESMQQLIMVMAGKLAPVQLPTSSTLHPSGAHQDADANDGQDDNAHQELPN
jgi:hypothetical protein